MRLRSRNEGRKPFQIKDRLNVFDKVHNNRRTKSYFTLTVRNSFNAEVCVCVCVAEPCADASSIMSRGRGVLARCRRASLGRPFSRALRVDSVLCGRTCSCAVRADDEVRRKCTLQENYSSQMES